MFSRRRTQEREKRVKPSLDEKILASWNGLMISSFVDGYRVTANEMYLGCAKKTAQFIIHEMRKDGHLMRVFSEGKAKIKGYSEDYAFFIQALIDLYEATFELEWLREADDLNQRMIDEFWDEENGGFFFTGKGDESLITRSKNPYDYAVPSSNSVSLFNLMKLGYLTGEESFKQKAEQVLHLFHNFLSEHPSGFPHMLSGLSFHLDPEEIGIIGSKTNPRTKSMIQEVYGTYLPNKILSLRDPQEPIEGSWFPFLKDKNSEEIPTAFVCKKFVCLPPAKNEKALKEILE